MDEVRKAFENYVNDTHQCGLSLRKQPNGLYASGNTATAFDDFQAGCASMQSELEAVKRERDELAAYVNELREGFNWIGATTRSGDIVYVKRIAAKALSRNPAQSLEANDRKVRNKVRRECMEIVRKHNNRPDSVEYINAQIGATIEPEE